MKNKGIFPIFFVVIIFVLMVVPLYSQDILNAISQGDLDRIKELIEENPELVKTRQGSRYPLHFAVLSRKKDIAEFLISKGADVNRFGKNASEFAPFEFTPLTEAIRNNDMEMIKMFVEHGADLHKTTSLGESYLHFAAFLNRTELAGYFIDSGLDVNIRKSGNLTPLHMAAVTGYREVAELLIEKGADLNARSTDGGAPLHFALAAGNQDIAQLLKSKGAKDIRRNFPVYKGKYLGVKKSGSTPEPFAPELFRDIYRVHSTPAFSPDGKEVYWECMFMPGNNDAGRVWFMKEENGLWNAPKVAPFSEYPSGGPAFFHDGNKLVYFSVRPRDNSTMPAKDPDLWVVERNGDTWSEPKHLETPLNKDGSPEVYPLVSKDGTMYVGVGRLEYVKSAFVNGKYLEPETIGDLFNTDVVDTCKEQESILFFSDKGRDERYEYEIYISYHRPDGRWSKPINLGERLHPGRRATQAIVSFDGQYLFFVSYFYYYWVDAKIIEDLKPKDEFPVLKGPYLGQKPPGMIPEIFAPGIISTGHDERIAAFTPDGKEFYFVLYGAPHMIILFTKEENGRWTKPRVTPFSDKYGSEFNISPDGNKIVFASFQPLNNQGAESEIGHTWIVERSASGWSEPKPLRPELFGYPSLSLAGHLYFNPRRKDGMGGEDIYISKLVDGEYAEPENLGEQVNSDMDEVDPFIAPDESYIIFLRRDKEGFGGFDLFVSFRKDDGSWTKAKNMGEPINSSASELCPSVSPDGKYFFFTSYRSIHKPYSEKPLTYEEKIRILNSPGNGMGDIYWVDAKIINDLKPKNLN